MLEFDFVGGFLDTHRIAQRLDIQDARRSAMDDAAQNEDRWLCDVQALRVQAQLFDVVRLVVIKRVGIVGLRQTKRPNVRVAYFVDIDHSTSTLLGRTP